MLDCTLNYWKLILFMSMFKEVLMVTSLKGNPIRHPTKIISEEVRGGNDTEEKHILPAQFKEFLPLLRGDNITTWLALKNSKPVSISK